MGVGTIRAGGGSERVDGTGAGSSPKSGDHNCLFMAALGSRLRTIFVNLPNHEKNAEI